MKTTRRLFARGKVTVPSTIREEYDLDDGDLVEIEVHPVERGPE
jgi:bifunctional DNA-binding transcriptional regulator/antitoxin component of YhaV-PrlF toxin-antitoxin module